MARSTIFNGLCHTAVSGRIVYTHTWFFDTIPKSLTFRDRSYARCVGVCFGVKFFPAARALMIIRLPVDVMAMNSVNRQSRI